MAYNDNSSCKKEINKCLFIALRRPGNFEEILARAGIAFGKRKKKTRARNGGF